MFCWMTGMVYAIDINKGRLRILGETAKLHQVNSVVTTIHSDLREFVVSNQSLKGENLLKVQLLSHILLSVIFLGQECSETWQSFAWCSLFWTRCSLQGNGTNLTNHSVPEIWQITFSHSFSLLRLSLIFIQFMLKSSLWTIWSGQTCGGIGDWRTWNNLRICRMNYLMQLPCEIILLSRSSYSH